MDEKQAYDVEENLIRRYGRRGKDEGGVLTSICLETGHPPTRRGKDNGFFGRKHSLENRQIFSENARKQFTGYKQSPEHIAKRVAAMDRESQRQRQIHRNKSPFMRAVTAQSNIKKGRNRTLNKISKYYPNYVSALIALTSGAGVSEVAKQSGVSYHDVWRMSRNIEYYRLIIQEITNAQQK